MKPLGPSRTHARRPSVAQTLMARMRGRFSRELGLHLASRRRRDLFLWLLAAILYGARISGTIATRTHREFVRRGLDIPERLLETGWDGLVEALDAGGYTRYDFKTATKLLEVAGNLKRQYAGDLNALHQAAVEAKDLERRLMALGRGVGPVTVQIFLRELRGIWSKARPPVSPLTLLAARHLGLVPAGNSQAGVATAIRKKTTFSDFEAALLRVRRDYCRRSRCRLCPMRDLCGGRQR